MLVLHLARSGLEPETRAEASATAPPEGVPEAPDDPFGRKEGGGGEQERSSNFPVTSG